MALSPDPVIPALKSLIGQQRRCLSQKSNRENVRLALFHHAAWSSVGSGALLAPFTATAGVWASSRWANAVTSLAWRWNRAPAGAIDCLLEGPRPFPQPCLFHHGSQP